MQSEVVPIRVLLVEDEFLISAWVAESLAEQGFAVHAVSNATDALQHLASEPVDVLFTDINLPGGLDGAALARRRASCCRGCLSCMPRRAICSSRKSACQARSWCRSRMRRR